MLPIQKRKHYIMGMLPFLPLFVGILLKFSLIDEKPVDLVKHFKDNYIDGVWIDLIVTSYITGSAWFISRINNLPKETASIFSYIILYPAICFVACIVLTHGLKNANIEFELLTIYLPAIIGATSIAVSGTYISRSGMDT